MSLAPKLHNTAGMDQLTATATSGMRSRIESLDLLANNISNASTSGYKSDREFYGLYVAADAETQAAVIHYYVDEMTMDEVATLLERSVPTIRKRLRAYAEATGREVNEP